MIKFLMDKIVGSKNAREIKKMQPRVAQIAELEPAMKDKSDAELQAYTPAFKQRIANGEALDSILPEAFALVREVGRRRLGMRHYDVQMIGGMVLHRGTIAEMKTGEGKTLVATLPIYLNALEERGAHLVTVNDYLARRDADWMSGIYNFLGMSVGVIYHDMPDRERQEAYRSDITYGQNNEFGFDYLRDNMKDSIELYAQRELHYAIVDEVDSILIDEARTPLIISGPAEESAGLYHRCNDVVLRLKKDVDYSVDEKAFSAMLTDTGVERVEKELKVGNLYDPQNISWLHHITQALQAHALYKRDVKYVVEESKVLIIDEHTGRKMPGRRWSDGLHQAIEAKENVEIEEENQTLATITFQNFFRMYNKLAGMTGTAETEAEEFYKIYKLECLVIPTNKPVIRKDHHDVIYNSEKAKFKWAIEEIIECHEAGQPVLVGTASVEKSEVLSKLLKKRGIKHHVLNAKHHQREAEIVAQAGRKGSVTISTSMAGRGTDIVLGGNAEALAKQEANPDAQPDKYEAAFEKYKKQCSAEREEVLAAGGLHILSTERHESRRIDNQLRGRSGRQGDPGSSRFYLSLEDDLLRIFGAERIQGLMSKLGMKEDEPIEHRFVNKAIENAQKKVEGHNFDIRKHLLDYDDVMNQQRKTIYKLRKEVLEGIYTLDDGDDDEGEAEKAAPPIKSGEWTVESLGEKLRPRVTQIVETFFEGVGAHPYRLDPKPEDYEAEDSGDGDGKEKKAKLVGEVDNEALTHELYRYFGAVVNLRAERNDAKKCIAKAIREVAVSLIQQRERILDLCDQAIGAKIDEHCPEKVRADEWNIKALEDALEQVFAIRIDLNELALDRQVLAEKAWEQVEKVIEARETELGPIYFLYFARHFYLDEIDTQWIDHLRAMDYLRQGIGLEGYGQRDPKQIYKQRGFDMFSEMMERIHANVISKLFRIQVQEEDQDLPQYRHKKRKMSMGRGDMMSMDGDGEEHVEVTKTIRRATPRVGRNDPCPCGSGKKYKKCHGANPGAHA
ncbi:MAG: preprotein translocase subunit SecA [Myxococcales bacterium]|nr:preprotein translocase subunit SecA [Myxococcales bacterium]